MTVARDLPPSDGGSYRQPVSDLALSAGRCEPQHGHLMVMP
jgi:hypothetical protein